MRAFGWFALLSAFWVLIELSFFEILLPSVRAPLFLLAFVAALPIVLGARSGFLWAVGTLGLYDIIRIGELSPLVLFGGAAAFLTSLLIERLRFDFGYQSRFSLALWLMALVVAYDMIMTPLRWPSVAELALVLPVSLLVLASVAQLKAWLDSTSLSEFRGLRQSS